MRNTDIDAAEEITDQINELREKAIIFRNLRVIEENEKAVSFISSKDSENLMTRKLKNSMTNGNILYSN